jgi:hypothetical protein
MLPDPELLPELAEPLELPPEFPSDDGADCTAVGIEALPESGSGSEESGCSVMTTTVVWAGAAESLSSPPDATNQTTRAATTTSAVTPTITGINQAGRDGCGEPKGAGNWP